MAIPKPAILVGVGSAAVVGGGLASFGYLNSSQSISERLLASGYRILKNDSNEWTEILKHYKEVEQKTLHFEDFDGTKPEQGAETTLKEKCQKALNSKSTDDNIYQKALQWCTEPRTIATEISKNYRLLSTDTSSDKDEDLEDWNKKMVDHEAHKAQEEKISELGLDTGKATSRDKAERDKIRKKCKAFENKKHYEKDFQATLKKSELWCAIAK